VPHLSNNAAPSKRYSAHQVLMKNIGSSFNRSVRLVLALVTGAALLIGGEVRAGPASSIVVPVSGTVTDAAGSVALSGQAAIESTLVQDETGGAPSVILSIHMTNLTGQGIQASGEAVIIRPLAATDTVEVVLSVGSDIASEARTATATFALSLDLATGAVLTATGAVQ
jgi:hypothetical protein